MKDRRGFLRLFGWLPFFSAASALTAHAAKSAGDCVPFIVFEPPSLPGTEIARVTRRERHSAPSGRSFVVDRVVSVAMLQHDGEEWIYTFKSPGCTLDRRFRYCGGLQELVA